MLVATRCCASASECPIAGSELCFVRATGEEMTEELLDVNDARGSLEKAYMFVGNPESARRCNVHRDDVRVDKCGYV